MGRESCAPEGWRHRVPAAPASGIAHAAWSAEPAAGGYVLGCPLPVEIWNREWHVWMGPAWPESAEISWSGQSAVVAFPLFSLTLQKGQCFLFIFFFLVFFF